MISLPKERMIAELLDDPIILMMMRADHVDTQAMRRELYGLAWRLERRAAPSPTDCARGHAALVPTASLTRAVRAVASACGACRS